MFSGSLSNCPQLIFSECLDKTWHTPAVYFISVWRKHPVTLHRCPAPHATGACCFTWVSFYLPSLSTLFSHKGESLEVSTSKRDDCRCGSSCGSLTVRTCHRIFSVQSPLVFYPNPRLLLKAVPDFSGSSASQWNAHEPSSLSWPHWNWFVKSACLECPNLY